MSEELQLKVAKLVKKGEQFFKFGELEAAKESFKDAIELDKGNAEVLYKLGIIHRDSKEIEKARKYLREAIAADEHWLKPLETLGNLEYTLDNDRDAVKILTEYLNKGGSDLETLLTLARAAYEIDDCKTVMSATSKILDIDDNISQVWVMRGICQAKMDRFNAACTSLNVAVELNPGSVSALNKVGELSYHAKNYPAAIEIYSSSHEINDAQPEVLFHLGVSHWYVDNWSEAIPFLEKYVKIAPEDPRGWNNLGVVLREKGDVKRAMECYSKALSLDPSLETVRTNMETAKDMEMLL